MAPEFAHVKPVLSKLDRSFEQESNLIPHLVTILKKLKILLLFFITAQAYDLSKNHDLIANK